ncbi:MAG: hypothetical protein K6F91_09470 [Ruminococcus sp.]|nr:hypothetical protein [Ruminococcus sp.]
MVNIELSPREKIKRAAEKDSMSKDCVVFCFYGDGEEQIDFSKTKSKGLCAKLEDISYDEIQKLYNNGNEFFEEADIIAGAAIEAVAEGNMIICEESTLGASCAAAILEFFTGGGMLVYNKHKCRQHDYGLNVEVYEKVYSNLCCLKLLHDDIDFDKLRTGRAAVNRQEMISRIYDIMHREYEILKNCEEHGEGIVEDLNEGHKTSDGFYISVRSGTRSVEEHNEVFAFSCVTKDKVYHGYCGFLHSKLLGDFLDKYTKDDIEYFGVEFNNENNDYGVSFFDSECGDSFTDEHLSIYFSIIKDKYNVTDKDIFD